MVVAFGLRGLARALKRPGFCKSIGRGRFPSIADQGRGGNPQASAMAQALARLSPAVSSPAPISSVPPVRLTTFWTEGLRMVFRAAEARSA